LRPRTAGKSAPGNDFVTAGNQRETGRNNASIVSPGGAKRKMEDEPSGIPRGRGIAWVIRSPDSWERHPHVVSLLPQE
ncbi:MAG: hypothetical protein ACK56F_19880, partial [bacterium]